MNKLTVDIKNKCFFKAGSNERFIAIKDLHFELSNNEFVCIIGPSGCGKTTLLNTISGLDKDYDGSIETNDNNNEISSSYVFQTPRLLPWRTVLENIQLATGDTVQLPKIEALLHSLGLSENLHSYPHHLSLGMQRRAALARAFCVQNDILLMDEPFVSLDQPTARKARKLLLSLWQEQPRSVIFVTHDLDESIELADRILFLSESPSKIIADVPINILREERNNIYINNFKEQLRIDHQEIAHLL